MRQTLGTSVFFGMLGVTFFGLFLTPVFYYVLQGLSELLSPHGPHQKAGSPPADVPLDDGSPRY